jgi:hypothetical protein
MQRRFGTNRPAIGTSGQPDHGEGFGSGFSDGLTAGTIDSVEAVTVISV